MSNKTFKSIKTFQSGKTESPGERAQALHNELYRAFDMFNEIYCGNALPKCLITIQNKGRRSQPGLSDINWCSDTETLLEINISAEYDSRGALGILEALLHEMAHYFNAYNNVRDVTGSQYHNKFFKSAAEMLGLKVQRVPHKGWSHTELLPETEAFIKRNIVPNEELFKQLKRVEVNNSREDKYVSLIVAADIGESLKEAVKASGQSQKQFVQEALLNKISQYITVQEPVQAEE